MSRVHDRANGIGKRSAPQPDRHIVLGLFVIWSGVLVASILVGAVTGRHTRAPRLSVGDPAPAFSLPLLFDPTESRSLADYHGQAVVLAFWSSQSVESRGSLILLDRLQRDFSTEDVRVIAIALEAPQDVTSAVGMAHQLAPTIQHLNDPNWIAAQSYHLTQVPSWFVVGRDGLVKDQGRIPTLSSERLRSSVETRG